MAIKWKVTDDSLCTISVEDEEGWYTAFIKKDGCLNFRRYFNVPLPLRVRARSYDEGDDSLHICELDDMIEILQSIKVLAVKKFGNEWGK